MVLYFIVEQMHILFFKAEVLVKTDPCDNCGD